MDFTPFINNADLVVNDIEVAASPALTADRLKLICLYLAAHFAELSYTSGAIAAESVGDVTERFHNVYDAGLKTTRYGQQAIMLDTSGYLAQLSSRAENPNIRGAEFRVV